MNKIDHYRAYQDNLKLLEAEIRLVKKATQSSLGMKAYYEEKGIIKRQKKIDFNILAGTRLLSFLICSWLEIRLYKILHEDSSVNFNDQELNDILSKKTINDKWKATFERSVCKSFNFKYPPSICITKQTYSTAQQKTNIQETLSFFTYISDAITNRNKLAHGQWHAVFNSKRSKIIQHTFLADFDNIQKLDNLFKAYKLIAEIISSYVVYKDKSNPNFDNNIMRLIRRIKDAFTRINQADFSKYILQLKKNTQKYLNGCQHKT